MDVLLRFVKAYNTVHRALGMAPVDVTGKHVLEIWTGMNIRHVVRVKFNVGQQFYNH